MRVAPDRLPVIIGVGEVLDRPDSLDRALEPAALIASALRRADADAGRGWLGKLDSLDVVNSVSWPYADLPGRVADRIGCHPRHLSHGPVGGETPIRFFHEAAIRIARGESAVAAVCGGEAEHSAAAARRAGIDLPWTEPDPGWTNPRRRGYLHPLALRHGLSQPVYVYPLYENACQAAWGQKPRQGQAESANLWSRFSEIAAHNEFGWLRRQYTPEEIATPSASNRPIAWPYPKLMVANPVVNQGAAILLTSLAAAREAGLPKSRLIHIWTGSAASEPRDWLSRDRFDRSPAQDAVLGATLDRAGLGKADIDALELYSCFPCVPKMARRTLGLPSDVTTTVAGGLTFFGAPLNNYMTHAAAAMVRRLRARPGVGLLYGQGEFVTKHHALVVANAAPDRVELHDDISVQDEADRRRGPVPEIRMDAVGAAELETHTVFFDRDGQPTEGAVVLRLPDGARTLARVPAGDRTTLARLMDLESSPIGFAGNVRQGLDGRNEWTLA